MARFTSDKKNYINDTVKFSMENNYGAYNKFLDSSAPIFIVYYKQNILETTTDIGFGNVQTMIGKDSPITFNRINHLPLYGVDTAIFDLNYDDISGISGSSESQGILLPNTIEPIANDYFTVEYMDNKYLYKITDIDTEDHIKSNNYYKISFKYDGPFDERILNQVSSKYTCLYDNIGTEDVTILKDDVLELCKKCDDKLDILKDKYLNVFLLDATNNVVLPIDKNARRFLYDPYLIEFIDRNNIFKKDRSFKSLVMKNNIDLDDDFEAEYLDSIYKRLEDKLLEDFSVSIRHVPINGYDSYYAICGDDYYMPKLQQIYDVGTNDIMFTKSYGTLVTYNLLITELLDGATHPIFILGKFIKDYLTNTVNNEDILNSFIDMRITPIKKDLDNFIYYPILFFIIKSTIDNIIIKNK